MKHIASNATSRLKRESGSTSLVQSEIRVPLMEAAVHPSGTSRSSEQNFCVEIVKEVQTPVRLCAELAELRSLYRSGACAT